MFNLNDNELYKYINEDLPFLDYTTFLQDTKDKKATLQIYTREDIIVSCSEEAARIAELLGCKVKKLIASSTKLEKGNTILKIKGKYEDIHKTIKLSQILLEYSCKISTTTYKMIEILKSHNNSCELLTTRKTIPFNKKMCIKAILSGGALPHRLGLSDSILYFDYHRKLYNSNEQFYKQMVLLKNRLPEKRLVVESKQLEDSIELINNNIDVIQLDKVDIDTTKKIIEYKNKKNSNIKILLAGGINLSNIQEYAKLNADGIVTSSMYSCGMSNIGCNLKIKE
ncbi:molybdenum ABC transporter [Arcobacter sp. CECT 8985]|uniref:molybdenum ABC transporter n=1 Tax=Arcobacter sp. CECT 8985 TaxID=1935424 RepID=UPI00100B83F7|nr:molybdenum ABC transporter [Arcobacter sp. CECT 8985]RXJ86535.1 molybdenum ABC transporter [Arcobacter sp. CECT 8985]